jgi:protein ImuA
MTMQSQRAAAIANLRRTIHALETGHAANPVAGFRSGASKLDEALGGGFEGRAISEIRAGSHRDGAAATRFALSLAAMTMKGRPGSLVWIRGRKAGDFGIPSPSGLARIGLAPDRVLLVGPLSPEDAQWAAEEALGVGGLSCLLMQPDVNPGLVASRRLQLAAEQCGAPVLIVSGHGADVIAPARTRFEVSTRASRGPDWLGPRAAAGWMQPVGPARWDVTITRRGQGASTLVDVEWCDATHRLCDSPGLAHRTPSLATGFERAANAA